MDKPKVIFILENFYGFRSGRLRFPAYRTNIINKKNATYSRIIPFFEDLPFELWFGETTPYIATDKKTKFPVDTEWLKKTVEFKDWFAVISCCKSAETGLKTIDFEPFCHLPHPTSFLWRKTLIEQCVANLLLKYNE